GRGDAPEGRPHGCARRARQAGGRSPGADGAVAPPSRSRQRNITASPRCAALMPAAPSRSAMVRASLSTRWRARPESPRPCIVASSSRFPASSTTHQRCTPASVRRAVQRRSEEHTSELQSRENLVCRLLLEKKKDNVIKEVSHILSPFCCSAVDWYIHCITTALSAINTLSLHDALPI